MSLLMDALKRAEEAKRQSPSAATAGEPLPNPRELTLEPQPGGSPLPDIDSHLAAMEAELQEEASQPSPVTKHAAEAPPPPAPRSPDHREAARNVFAAKKTAATPPASGRQGTIALAVGGGVAALGIVGYFGYQYLTLTGVIKRTPAATVATAAPASTRPVYAPPPTQKIATEGAETAPAASASAASAGQSGPSRASPASPSFAASPAPAASSARQPRATPPAKAPAAHRPNLPKAAATATPAEPGVRVASRAPQVPAGVLAAYDALQAGRLGEAQATYTRVLQDDPRNEDALLGLATIAARQGQKDRAEAHYLRLLELDPKNAAAHAGLAGIGNYGDPAQRESRIKTLLASPPADATASGMLHFALGNLYAEQRRWSEAQQAYFQALTADAENPDYQYNLAVSLDHLRQHRLAAQYYEAALAAASKRTAAFNPQQARARLAALPR